MLLKQSNIVWKRHASSYRSVLCKVDHTTWPYFQRINIHAIFQDTFHAEYWCKEQLVITKCYIKYGGGYGPQFVSLHK